MLKFITGIFMSIDPIGDDEEDNPEERLINDVQLAAGPFMKHQHALTQLKAKCPPGKWRRKYDATMALPATMEALHGTDGQSGPAEQQLLYLQDILVDTPDDEKPVEMGNFDTGDNGVWQTFCRGFRQSTTAAPWYDLHAQFYRHKDMVQGANESVGTFIDAKFRKLNQSWISSGLPPRDQSLDANVFFAGIGAYLRSALIDKFPDCCRPQNSPNWSFADITGHAISIERSAKFQQEKLDRKAAQRVHAITHDIDNDNDNDNGHHAASPRREKFQHGSASLLSRTSTMRTSRNILQ